ncbi:MAG: phosphatase PAP2 family protein [Clostridia bacterium]|nr:phosphatase PAP2 family protein [Clostridia bacterium]
MLSYVYWIAGYIAISRVSRERCRMLCRADYISKAIAAACFVLIPTTLPRDPISGGLFEWALNIIYTLDSPYNLFPSMHCLFSWLIAREMMGIKEFRPAVKAGAVIFSFMVFASTLFTRQHFIVDIPAGMLVAEIARFISHKFEERRK